MTSYFFTFLRHGESVGNRDGYIQGQHDFPLTEAGLKQAEQITESWVAAGRQFDGIIASPLQRAHQTAEQIRQALEAPIETDSLWLERHRGFGQGLKKEESRANRSTDTSHLYERFGETGESNWQLTLRAGRALQSLFRRPPGRYLIVTHGALLNRVLHTILGSNPLSVEFALGNCTSIDVQYNPEYQQWRLWQYLPLGKQALLVHPDPAGHRLLLVRHAESEGNVNRIFQGQVDTDLTPDGHKQTRQAAHLISELGIRIDQILSSPQTRAWQTAEVIAKNLQLDVTANHLLKEIDNGKLAGLSIEEIEAQFPERPDRANPYLPVGETGESWLELYLRAGELIDQVTGSDPGGYLAVSHGAFLNSLLRAILGIIPQPLRNSAHFYIENTGIVDLAYSPRANQWKFLALLPPKELTF
jgi:probable phosphoglycerate mutase